MATRDTLRACSVKAHTPTRFPGDDEALSKADITCKRRLLPERFDFKVCLQSKFHGVFKNVANGCCGAINVRVDNSMRPWLMCGEGHFLRQGGPFTYRTRAKATRRATGASEVAVSGTVEFTN